MKRIHSLFIRNQTFIQSCKSFIILLFLVLSMIPTFSQKSDNVRIDSINNLIRSDLQDTNKLIHLNDLAWELMYKNLDTAILLNNQALELGTIILGDFNTTDKFIKKRTQKELANSNSQLGTCFRLKGDYPLSLIHHLKALEIREAMNDQRGISGSLYNIGTVYHSQGDYPKALEYYFKALRTSKELADKESMAVELGSIGLVYQKQEDYSLALEYLSKALKISEEVGNKNSVAFLLTNIGNIYYAQKAYPQTLKTYLKALKLAEELGNKNLMATLIGNIGSVYSDQGDFYNALENYSKALKLAQELGEKASIARHLGNMGTLYLRSKKYKEAEGYLLKALASSTEIGSLDLIKDHNKDLSDLYAQTNRYQLAYEHHVKFSAAKDSLFNDEKSKDIGKLEARHEMEMAEKDRAAQAEMERKTELEKRRRRDLLQYSGIVVLLLIVGLLVGVLGFIKVKPWVASSITFFAFLLFFEFLLVLLDPTIDKWSEGEPAYKLLLNATIAACIFPLHAFFERMLKKRLIKLQ